MPHPVYEDHPCVSLKKSTSARIVLVWLVWLIPGLGISRMAVSLAIVNTSLGALSNE